VINSSPLRSTPCRITFYRTLWRLPSRIGKSWILGTITDDLVETISARNSTASDAWLDMESQFFNNRETRALLLEAMFRNFVQGDQSITEYTKDLKRKADMLADLGEVINDRTLVLHLTHRLNERFKQVGMLLCHGRPSPLRRGQGRPSPRGTHDGAPHVVFTDNPRRLHRCVYLLDPAPRPDSATCLRGLWTAAGPKGAPSSSSKSCHSKRGGKATAPNCSKAAALHPPAARTTAPTCALPGAPPATAAVGLPRPVPYAAASACSAGPAHTGH